MAVSCFPFEAFEMRSFLLTEMGSPTWVPLFFGGVGGERRGFGRTRLLRLTQIH